MTISGDDVMTLKKNFTFSVEDNLRIRVTGSGIGFIESQSVQTLLLYAILQELQAQREELNQNDTTVR